MKRIIVAAGAAILVLAGTTAEAQTRRGTNYARGDAAMPSRAPGRMDNRLVGPGNGTITWNTPYPNGNLSMPGPSSGGGP